jgi:hypothetical protein
MTEPSTPENVPPAAPAAPEAPPAEQDVSQLPPWARDAITKANTEAAKYRTQVRELEPKAQQFTQLEEASKSELQRIQEAHDAAARDRDAAVADRLRLQVALAHGVGADDIDLLGSGTEEEITARAQRIAAMKAAAAPVPTPPPSGRSRENLQPGATPAPVPDADSVEARHRQFFAPRYAQQPQ